MTPTLRTAIFCALAVTGATAAYADTTLALYNTGCSNTFNNACNAMSHGTADPHYGGQTAYVWSSGWPTLGPWIGSNNTSTWIRPDTNGPEATDTPRHTFTWTQQFVLNGDAKSLDLAGRWAADNNASVYLNGHLISSLPTNYEFGYTQWTSFQVNNASYLLNGVNTLTFAVYNMGGQEWNPAGLRVEFTKASATVPEPSEIVTSAGLLLGLGVAALRRHRR
ncbi:hypothetical protein F183_A24640 [Bryobacterales bacterium F-183]|nr:hypothetical protein F183_A24640 [Bryobacterales bacterium F-183]